MKFYWLLVFLFLPAVIFAAEYDRIITEMNNIITANPDYVQMIDIGKNDQNATIYGMRVENRAYVAEGGKLNMLLVGVHHGNERNTADLCTNFTKKLIAVFKNPNDPNYKALSRSVFFVVPVLNISGFNASRRTETSSSGGTVDPNRDYTDVCVQGTYFRLASTKNLDKFLVTNNIVGAVTAHGYVGTFTYPWGIYTDNSKTQDNDFYNYLGTNSIKANNYRTGTHTDIIYPAAGSFEDWAYAHYGIWTMLLELASSANLDKDSQCLLTYFSLLPADRSTKNQHTGKCTSTRGEEDGRP